MTNRQCIAQTLIQLARDTRGNFAIMTALSIPILLGIGGAAMEVARAMQIKSDLQAVADAGTLSASTKARLTLGKIQDAELIQAANAYIAASQFAQELSEEEREQFAQTFQSSVTRRKSEKGEEFEVTTAIQYPMKLNPLLSFIGQEKMMISVESKAKSSFNLGAALSLYLVLDRSGSMSFKTDTVDTAKKYCRNYDASNWNEANWLSETTPCYVTKIASLKLAVNFLADTLKDSDNTYSANSSPASKMIRTGAVAYNDAAFTAQALGWGVAASLDYVKKIPEKPEGGTSAVDALGKALSDLRKSNSSEANAHNAAGNTSFERFIVFMTDGEMTGASSTWNSAIDSSVRALCTEAKNDGISIFTIAFMAPDRGQKLLKACASSANHYYAPEKMSELVVAFGDIAKKASSVISTLTN